MLNKLKLVLLTIPACETSIAVKLSVELLNPTKVPLMFDNEAKDIRNYPELEQFAHGVTFETAALQEIAHALN